MPELGKYNKLKINRQTDNGFYLIDEKEEEVLLPNAYLTKEMQIGDEIEVFVYKDSEDRITATTEKPFLQVGEFACLQVSMTSQIGAFLNWGLPKDLLCPFSEQAVKMLKGKRYIIHLYLDEKSERLVASSKINKYIEKENIELKEGQEVDLLIAGKVELGYKCIINNKYQGLIFDNEVFQDLHFGEKTKGFVKKIREDKKIDISLQQQGFKTVEPNAQKYWTSSNKIMALSTSPTNPTLKLLNLNLSSVRRLSKKLLEVYTNKRKWKLRRMGFIWYPDSHWELHGNL
jgi:predicted RNA-binding protein (virulence factor B family)